MSPCVRSGSGWNTEALNKALCKSRYDGFSRSWRPKESNMPGTHC